MEGVGEVGRLEVAMSRYVRRKGNVIYNSGLAHLHLEGKHQVHILYIIYYWGTTIIECAQALTHQNLILHLLCGEGGLDRFNQYKYFVTFPFIEEFFFSNVLGQV